MRLLQARFDAEMALAKAKLTAAAGAGGGGGAAAGGDKAGRLTGKQWFMQQEAQHIEVRAVRPFARGKEGWERRPREWRPAWAGPAQRVCRGAGCHKQSCCVGL